MGRFFFNLIAVLSLAFCIALIPLWLGRTVNLNLHHGSIQIDMYHQAVCWSSSADDEYNGTISFFVSDPRLGVSNDDDPNHVHPQYLGVRARHPSGLWLGAERGSHDRDRVGWFSLWLPTAIAVICPLLWIVRRSRKWVKSRRRGESFILMAALRRFAQIIALAALTVVVFFWIASSCGYHLLVGGVWAMETQPGQSAITFVFAHEPSIFNRGVDIGGNCYWTARADWPTDPSIRVFHYETLFTPPPTFAWGDDHQGKNAAPRKIGILVRVPDWILFIAAAIFPALDAWGWRRRRLAQRRGRNGLCVKCGYDLRATPGRCPECGEARAMAR